MATLNSAHVILLPTRSTVANHYTEVMQWTRGEIR